MITITPGKGLQKTSNSNFIIQISYKAMHRKTDTETTEVESAQYIDDKNLREEYQITVLESNVTSL